MRRIHGKSYDASRCAKMDSGLLQAEDREKMNETGDADSKFGGRVAYPMTDSTCDYSGKSTGSSLEIFLQKTRALAKSRRSLASAAVTLS